MSRREARAPWMVPVLVASAVFGLATVAVVSTGDPVIGTPTGSRPERQPRQTPTRTDIPKPPTAGGGDSTPLAFTEWVIKAIVVAAAIALLCLLVLGVRALFRLRWERTVPEPEQDSKAAIEETVSRSRELLRTDTPSNAVIACWTALLEGVAALGLQAHPSETATDVMQRVMSDLDVDDDALDELADLYREARFSDHPLTDEHRLVAQDALDRVQHSLGAREEVGTRE